MTGLPPEIQRQVERLRQRFIASLPGKADRLAALAADCETACWEGDSRSELQAMVHRLAGSLGMHGLDGAQRLAESLDQALEQQGSGGAALQRQLESLIEVLRSHR